MKNNGLYEVLNNNDLFMNPKNDLSLVLYNNLLNFTHLNVELKNSLYSSIENKLFNETYLQLWTVLDQDLSKQLKAEIL